MNCRICCLVILAAAATALIGVPFAAAETILANADFEQGQPGHAPEQWRVPEIPGYEVLICDENPKSGKQCLMIKRTADDEAGPFGNVMQGIDASPFRGKRLRYRAAVRTQSGGDNGVAQLWFRVDLPEKDGRRRIGFFDNMSARPIRSSDWDYYDIVGDIAEDAKSIALGMFLRGSGQAWLDDVSLEIVDKDGRTTGRDLGTMTSLDDIGPGLLQIFGAMEVLHASSVPEYAEHMAEAGIDIVDDWPQNVDVLIPLPLAYRQQVPLTYQLAVYPSEAATGITTYQDTPYNHVAKVSLVLRNKSDKIYIKFRSVVLVAPESFSDIPDRANIPDHWPEEPQPWLASTWCVESQNDKIQALSGQIRDEADDPNDVMALIVAVQKQAGTILADAQGDYKGLTAVAALTSRGSCTSNANLVAALLRACNIPARVVSGYPSWSGPLQTHYIVEAWVPQFGWYPIEPSRLTSPWPNEYQVNVAVIPPKYESRELADGRAQAAAGVPYLSLTETPNAPSGIIVRGSLGPNKNCDHQCDMVRKFATGDAQWDAVLNAAKARWQKWLASKPHPTEEDQQLILELELDTGNAASPSELKEELML